MTPGTAAFIAFAGMSAAMFAQQAPPPTFRAGTALVPIDVRVVDKDGRPVTDLTNDDFRVFEDGVPQTISQFEKDTAGDPAHPRWLVIVIGEGRIQAPGHVLDALEELIRNGLGAADRVGVIAYNRWADFTADHASTIALLQRYKARADQIQTDLETYNSGLREQTHNGLDADIVQDDIDAIFRSAPGDAVREFAPPSQTGRMSMQAESSTRFMQMRFSDILHVLGAIDYLRNREGEKHVIFLVEQGSPFGPTRPSRLAMMAEDNRVALHIVQTGGFGERMTVASSPPRPGYGGRVLPPTSTAAEFNTSRAAHDATEDTGGLSFFYTDLRKAFARIGDAIRVDYLLGYVPSNQAWHGEYRKLEVRVSRPGATVIYRRGYHAVETPPPWNVREAMTDARMGEARASVRPLHGMILQLKAKLPPTARAVDVELQIEPSTVAFAVRDGRHVASLDVMLWVTDQKAEDVGTITDRIDLSLTDAAFGALVRQNIVYTRTVPVTGKAFDVRAGVYDYDNDRLGAVTTPVR
jgi:VWFA-related protein